MCPEGAEPPPVPRHLLEQYGHPPGGYRQQDQQAQQEQQPWGSEAASSAAAGPTSEAAEWQGPEAGSADSRDVKGSLRRKYSRLASSSSMGSRAGGGGSAGMRSDSFAAAAAAAVAAAGFAGSRAGSFRGSGGQLAGGREQAPVLQSLGTILESDRASSSSGGGSSSGGRDSGSGMGEAAGPAVGTAAGAAGAAEQARQPAAPSRFARQMPAHVGSPAAGGDAVPAIAPVAEDGSNDSTAPQPPADEQPQPPPQPPSLLVRLRSLLPGQGSPPGASGPAVPGSPRQLQQTLSGASRSRSLLRMLSSRQLSRISPHSAGEEPPSAGQPVHGPPTLQQQLEAAAQRLGQRPASLVPGGEAQQQQARLLAAAQRHLSRMQAAPDEATMHAERRQVGMQCVWTPCTTATQVNRTLKVTAASWLSRHLLVADLALSGLCMGWRLPELTPTPPPPTRRLSSPHPPLTAVRVPDRQHSLHGAAERGCGG